MVDLLEITDISVVVTKLREAIESLNELTEFLKHKKDNKEQHIAPVVPIHVKEEWKPNFELAYELYPRKLGKTPGMKKCKSTVKNEEDFCKLMVAVDNFNKFHGAKGTEQDFLPYFSTFMNQWTDWVNPQECTQESVKQGKRQQEQSNHYRSQVKDILDGKI